MWAARSAGPLLTPKMSRPLTGQSPEKWLNTLTWTQVWIRSAAFPIQFSPLCPITTRSLASKAGSRLIWHWSWRHVWERSLGLVYTFDEKATRRGIPSARSCLNYCPIFMPNFHAAKIYSPWIYLLSTEVHVVVAKLLSGITSPQPVLFNVLFIDTAKLLLSHHNTILVTKFSMHLIKISFNRDMNIIVCDPGH